MVASEVTLSFQNLSRFNFSWVLTVSPGEKHVIVFPLDLICGSQPFPQPHCLGEGLRAEVGHGSSFCWSLVLTIHQPSAVGLFHFQEQLTLAGHRPKQEHPAAPPSHVSSWHWVGVSWAQTPGLFPPLGNVSPKTACWLALEYLIVAE